MLTILLLTWLAYPAQEWCWDPVSGATGYNIYWSTELPPVWTTSNKVQVGAVNACPPGDPMECCDGGLTPELPQEAQVFYVVTAFNGVGESPTGHGPVAE